MIKYGFMLAAAAAFLCLCAASPLHAQERSQDRVLASGDGFEITRSYIRAIEDFYKLQSFTSTPDQYLRLAIRTRLFGLEAKALDLEPIELQVDAETLNPDSVREYDQVMTFVDHLTYSEAYALHLRRDFHVPHDVIESYYHANAEKFIGGPWSDDNVAPLDSDIKEQVRRAIISSIQKRIYDQAFEDLSEKYGVVIND